MQLISCIDKGHLLMWTLDLFEIILINKGKTGGRDYNGWHRWTRINQIPPVSWLL